MMCETLDNLLAFLDYCGKNQMYIQYWRIRLINHVKFISRQFGTYGNDFIDVL